jgi:hypothetical protein
MGEDNYIAGDNWVRCDRTGFKVRASDTVREWNGAIVRKQSAEPRHPQDYVRGRPDISRPAVVRSEQADYFLADNEVTRDDL